jgi:hypothetical protein
VLQYIFSLPICRANQQLNNNTSRYYLLRLVSREKRGQRRGEERRWRQNRARGQNRERGQERRERQNSETE